MSLRWFSQPLAMGHFTRVSQAISQVKGRPSREQERLKRLLNREAAGQGSV